MVIWYVVFGFLGGIIGGMGMGGGTLLIPLLVIFGGVSQTLSQSINLVSFIPMSGVSLFINEKQGLLRTQDIAYMIIPAVITCVGGSLLANSIRPETLRIYFGIFLVILGVFFLNSTLKNSKKQ